MKKEKYALSNQTNNISANFFNEQSFNCNHSEYCICIIFVHHQATQICTTNQSFEIHSSYFPTGKIISFLCDHTCTILILIIFTYVHNDGMNK